jgi:hypothetical protein
MILEKKAVIPKTEYFTLKIKPDRKFNGLW